MFNESIHSQVIMYFVHLKFIHENVRNLDTFREKTKEWFKQVFDEFREICQSQIDHYNEICQRAEVILESGEDLNTDQILALQYYISTCERERRVPNILLEIQREISLLQLKWQKYLEVLDWHVTKNKIFLNQFRKWMNDLRINIWIWYKGFLRNYSVEDRFRYTLKRLNVKE